MSDAELLALAAKAARIVLDTSTQNGCFDVCGNAVLDWHNGTTWNPLTDDGDAFRLASALGLVVDFSRPSAALPYFRHMLMEAHGDMLESARRAIVCAAAQIWASK